MAALCFFYARVLSTIEVNLTIHLINTASVSWKFSTNKVVESLRPPYIASAGISRQSSLISSIASPVA